MIEQHPLQPFLPEDARILMLGSFPPAKKRWCMDFFYPNYINDMWRIMGLVFFGDKDHFVDTVQRIFRKDAIVEWLTHTGIALYDTATAVIRTKNTASDKDLEVVEETDVDALLRKLPQCQAIVVTGQKAADVLTTHFGVPMPKVGSSMPLSFEGRSLRLYRMPSSSRAYPLSLEKKAANYEQMFGENLLV